MKNILKTLGVTLILGVAYYVYHVHLDYRFEEISKDKVYKSALIDPKKLPYYLEHHHIKTIIDLLDPGVQDDLNPAKQAEIDAEEQAVEKYNKEHNASVVHVNIPSGQVPTKKTLSKFYKVLDDKANYPVLIHCYHGTGRAQIYSAIYRVEYEGWKNEDARAKTRFIVQGMGYRSSFADGKSKGDFLMHYKPRKFGEEATIFKLNEKEK